MTREIRIGAKSGARQEWTTPELLRGFLLRQGVDLDVAARSRNSLTPFFIGPPDESVCERMVACDALAGGINWFHFGDRPFFNPPFSQIGKFVGTALIHHASFRARSAWALLPANTDTKWFHSLWSYGATFTFFLGRIAFDPPEGVTSKSGASFPSMLVEIHGGFSSFRRLYSKTLLPFQEK